MKNVITCMLGLAMLVAVTQANAPDRQALSSVECNVGDATRHALTRHLGAKHAPAPAMPSESLNCRFISNWTFGPSCAMALDSSRHLAFCGSGAGVFVVDVSDSALPVKLSEISTRDFIFGLCYLDNRLYVAAGDAGLRIISVSDSAHPTEVGYCDTPGRVFGVARGWKPCLRR